MDSSKKFSLPLIIQSLFIFLLFIRFGTCDISQDRKQCERTLIGLSPCLSYVGGKKNAPTGQCCLKLKEVLQTTPVCLCVLIKDRDDESLKAFNINATLALGLPDACHSPTDVSRCVELLHLEPNSPDARIFNDYANSHKGNNSTSSPPKGGNSGNDGSSGGDKSDGFGRRNLLRMEMVFGGIITVIFMQFLQGSFSSY